MTQLRTARTLPLVATLVAACQVSVLPAETAAAWLEEFFKLENPDAQSTFAVVQLARKTGDRYREISDRARQETFAWLERHGAAEHSLRLVRDGGSLDAEEQSRAFGESLPKGLRLG